MLTCSICPSSLTHVMMTGGHIMYMHMHEVCPPVHPPERRSDRLFEDVLASQHANIRGVTAQVNSRHNKSIAEPVSPAKWGLLMRKHTVTPCKERYY